MSGPLAGVVGKVLNEISAANEYSTFIHDQQRHRIVRGIVENYYGPEFEQEVIFDTNRSWCARMPVLNTVFPDSRVIACVRDVPWIIDSIERLVRANALSPSSIFQFQANNNVYSRTDIVANGEGMLGYPYNALKDAFYGEHAKKLLLVTYETLVTDPQRVMDAVYAFIDEPAYQHDFDNVEHASDEFDSRAGTPGLHAVRKKVGASARPTVLPPDVFNRFVNDAFWCNPQINPNGVQIV